MRFWRALVVLLAAGVTAACGDNVQGVGSDVDEVSTPAPAQRTLTPSDLTIERVRTLSAPVRVTLAFPPGNEVAECIEDYFAAVDAASEFLTIERMDSDRVPLRAKELRIRENGMVVWSGGDVRERLTLGTDLDKARGKIKRLDIEFQKRLERLSRVRNQVAYFIAGHEEHKANPGSEDSSDWGLKSANLLLTQRGFKVKARTGGIADSILDDARLIFLVGPQALLRETERETLVDWVREGGSLMVLADPVGPKRTEKDLQLDALLEPFGLQVVPGTLAHESHFVGEPSLGRVARSVLVTNSFGNHPSVQVLSKNRSRVGVISAGSGALVKMPAGEGVPEVTITLKARSGTWSDLDNDFEYDAETEKKKAYPFGAAVQLAAPEGAERPGGRVVVAMDSQLIVDGLLAQVPGNSQWFIDSVLWLDGDLGLYGSVAEFGDSDEPYSDIECLKRPARKADRVPTEKAEAIVVFDPGEGGVRSIVWKGGRYETRVESSGSTDEPGFEVFFRKNTKGEWETGGGPGNDKAQELLSQFSPLSAERRFDSLTKEELAGMGLLEPEGTLVVAGGSREMTLEVGGRSQGSGAHYLREPGSSTAFLISSSFSSPLKHPKSRLIERSDSDP